jgi:hypothetical protein
MPTKPTRDELLADILFRFLDAISNIDKSIFNIDKSANNFFRIQARIVAKQLSGKDVDIVDIGLLRRTCKDLINEIESLERIKEYLSYIYTELFNITRRR